MLPKTANKAKKIGYTSSWHPITLAQAPPPPPQTPYPPLKPPKMGFWQQVVPKKTTKKTGKKQLKLEKNNNFL